MVSTTGPRPVNVDVTFVSDTAILASGDVICATAEIPLACRDALRPTKLQNVVLRDEDDQGTAVDIVFFSANVSLGTVNGAPSISDANARKIMGMLSVAAADLIDYGGVRVACKSNLNMLMKSDTTSLWAALICRSGTPTYTASGLKASFTFEPS